MSPRRRRNRGYSVRPDGNRWRLRWREGGVLCSKSFAKRADAEDEGERIVKAIAAGQSLRPRSERLGDLIAKYVSVQIPRARRATQTIAGHVIELLMSRLGEERTLATINAGTIDELATEWAKTIGPATVNKRLRVVKAILRAGHRWRMMSEVPEVRFLREVRRLKRATSPEEFERLYAAAPNDWWRGMLLVCYTTGCRVNEASTLRWADVDLERATIRFPGDRAKGKADSVSHAQPAVVAVLRRLRDAGVQGGPFGAKVVPSSRHEFAREMAKRAGVEWTGWHDLRRGFATNNAGRFTGPELQRLMRHASPATTATYLRLADTISERTFEPKVGEGS